MGILIIHADHDTTASEWQRITDLVNSVQPGQTVQSTPTPVVEAATSVTTPDVAYQERQQAVAQHDEKLHDPQGEYSDEVWQSFSPQKRGSIKRHRNGNDAPFVAQANRQPSAAQAPVSDEMAALFVAAGLAHTDVETIQTAPVPAAQRETAPQPARNVADKASDLTPGQRTDLGIWASEKLADPKKRDLVLAFLAGKITATQAAVYATKGGKSNLAKDMARVAKFDLLNA